MSRNTHDHSRRRPRGGLRLLIAGVTIVAAAVALAACGSSGNSSSTSSATNSASTPNDPSGRSGRFASLRACLEKQGINLPSAPSGGRPPGNGGPPGAGRGPFKLPEGVSQSKFREALKKCGGGFRGRRNFSSAAAREALTKYAQCMRQNGVNLPAPNTSGKGPVFNTTGINTSSETFKNAQTKCQADLRGAFGGRRAGGPGGPPPGGEGGPPAGAGEPPGSEGVKN